MKTQQPQLLTLKTWLALVAACCLATFDAAGAPVRPRAPVSEDGVWQAAENRPPGQRRRAAWLAAGKGREFKLNHGTLRSLLARAPREFTPEARRAAPVLTLPMPDGTFARFRVVESPIMEPELAAKFPQFKTYAGQGIDDPTATVRLAGMPSGLHGHIRSSRGIVQVRPVERGDIQTHVSYDLRDMAGAFAPFECGTGPDPVEAALRAPEALQVRNRGDFFAAAVLPSVGSQLRTFRLAIAVTGEYTQRRGGTVEDGMAAIVNTVNRLNGIFEAEAAIRLVLVANNDLLVYTDPATDPYNYVLTNFAARATARAQNQSNIDAVIGSANYDIGHLLDTGGGGESCCIGAVCTAGMKASAVSGISSATEADDYWIYHLVPHEMGHQFGANHSWNGLAGSCTTDQYAAGAAYEPGSGSTIMSYQLNCLTDSLLVTNYYADAYYHSGSFDEINSYLNNTPCRVSAPTGNNPPIASAGGTFTIPARTPFTLAAIGSDPDGDAVTYSWEERDLGPRQAIVGAGSEDNGSSPLFRSYPAVPSPSRTFPRLVDVLNNTTTPGEQLPSRSRTMRFRVTARDHRAGGGGRAASDMQVTVASNAGPFVVTFPNTASTHTGAQVVTWNVAGTTNAPIRATNVNILLSTNGGFDFPITLAANTPNDGSEPVNFPDLFASKARIKVEAAGNIFFDISNTNFTIMPSSPWIVAAGTTLLNEGCPPANGAVDPGETVTVGFVLENIGGTAATNLSVSLLLTEGLLSPSVTQMIELLLSGGRSTNAFTFTADPGLACGGTLTARLRVQGGTTALGDLDVPLHLGSLRLLTSRFSNTNRIVHQNGPAVQYPSTILVSNLTDLVGKLTVTLSNVTHPGIANQPVMLVGPQGQAVYLMFGSWAGAATNLILEFDDDAAISLFELNQAVSGTYQPTVIEPALMFPMSPPAPPEPNARGLSAFIGTQPNGLWRLFVSSLYAVTGQIADGWSLSLTTSNTSCCSPLGLAIAQADSPDPVLVDDSLTYTITVTNAEANTINGVTLSNALPSGVVFNSATSTHGACEHSSGIVRCDLGTLPEAAIATVSIIVVPLAPGVLTNTVTVTHAGNAGAPSVVARALTTVQVPRNVYVEDIVINEGDTGTTNAHLRVFLSEPSELPVTVNYVTADGTALAGTDFIATNGVITFTPLESVRIVTVPVVNDLLNEGHETFLMTLSNPTHAVLGAKSQGTATIVDNDPLVFVSNATASEGNLGTTNLVFSVSARSLGSKTVRLTFATSNLTATAGSDYAAANGMVVLSRSRPSANILIAVGGDTAVEVEETFVLTFATPTNASLATNLVIGTILNDDGLPGVVDHFAWNAIAPTQFVDLSFDGVLTARDAGNQPVASFNSPVSLAALGSGQDTLVGTNSVGQWVFPFLSANHDARLQSIYLAGELGPAARITALALDVTTVPGATLSNWTIRLKHTPQTNYPVAAWEGVGWTVVHQTHLSLTSTGWVTFPFSTPFDYNGADSLMVDFSFNNTAVSTPGQCRYRNATGPSRSLAGQVNSTAGDPLAWSGTNLPTPLVSARIPNLRLTVNPVMSVAPLRSSGFVNGGWSGELLVPQAATSLVLRADDGDGHLGVSGAFAVLPSPDLDGDLLPDPWEVRYFGSTSGPDGGPNGDADQDGASNRAEQLAGTNPTNAASRLQLTAELSGADVRLRFTGQVGRHYRIERTASLNESGAWEAVPGAEGIAGSGAVVQVLDHGAAPQPQRFYRVVIP